MAIQNPNSSGQGHDPDHEKNPYHATLVKHGYEYSHSTPVNHSAYSVSPSHPDYKNQDIRVHHSYKHKDLKDHVVGVSPSKDGGHKWDVHKLGQGTSFTGTGWSALDKHLKGHLARAKKKANAVEGLIRSKLNTALTEAKKNVATSLFETITTMPTMPKSLSSGVDKHQQKRQQIQALQVKITALQGKIATSKDPTAMKQQLAIQKSKLETAKLELAVVK